MIRGIHYFSTELKTKIDVIPRSCFKNHQQTLRSETILRAATSDHSHSSFVSQGGGPRVAVSTAAFHARARGSFLGLGGLKETIVSSPLTRKDLIL